MIFSFNNIVFSSSNTFFTIDDKYYNIVKEKFSSETAKKFFDTDRIIAYLDDHKNGKADNSRKIWTIFVFLIWYEVYFSEKPAHKNHFTLV